MNAEYTLTMLDDGGYSWVWCTPDGSAYMGTADNERQASEAAEAVIRDWYAAHG